MYVATDSAVLDNKGWGFFLVFIVVFCEFYPAACFPWN